MLLNCSEIYEINPDSRLKYDSFAFNFVVNQGDNDRCVSARQQ